jgi:hypothetical protein
MEQDSQTMPEDVRSEVEALLQRKPWSPPELKTLDLERTEKGFGTGGDGVTESSVV